MMAATLSRGVFIIEAGTSLDFRDVRRLTTELDVMKYLGRVEPLVAEDIEISEWVEQLCRLRRLLCVNLRTSQELPQLRPALRAFVASLPWSIEGESGALWDFLEHQARDTPAQRKAREFAGGCIEWPNEFRGKSGNRRWLVDSAGLVFTEGRVHIKSEVLARAEAQLGLPYRGLLEDALGLDGQDWLPFVSLGLLRRAKRISSAENEIQRLMRRAMYKLGLESDWRPWSNDFPQCLRGLPLSWLYQSKATQEVAALLSFLREHHLTHIGHLQVFHPGFINASQLFRDSDWRALYSALQNTAKATR